MAMPKPVEPGCKNCKFLDVQPDKAGRLIVRPNKAYSCTYPLPEMPQLPDCLRHLRGSINEKQRHYCWAEDGKDCPTYQERVK